MVYRATLRAALGLLFTLFATYGAQAQCAQDYGESVEKIMAAAEALPGEHPRAVFAGSSSFRLWRNMAEYFPEYEVVNAGIGGSCFQDLWRYKKSLIEGLEPDVLVIYEGDNDVVYMDEVPEILADAEQVLAWIREENPALPVYILSPKPSPARWKFAPKYHRLNTALEELAGLYGMRFVDCWPALTDGNGDIREELYVADGIHLNNDGNALLGQLLHDALNEELGLRSHWNASIDGWHQAAAEANAEAYFGFMTAEGVFQGTDGSEYWTKAAFEDFGRPYFERGRAWTFTPAGEREFYMRNGVVHFTERLDSEHMGKCRGTGVLVERADGWKLDFYSLSFEVPNEIVGDLVELATEERMAALKFQAELDAHYKDPEHSPLSEEDRKAFTGHQFYPVDLSYRVEATLDLTPRSKPFDMATTSGKSRKYRKYADLSFTLHGITHRIPVYQSLRLMEMEGYENHLFLPFRDRTSGHETYGTGRFMDLEIPSEGTTVILDFNTAYNPYCAYSDGYSCPITPSENFIDADIRAGIKGPVDGH